MTIYQSIADAIPQLANLSPLPGGGDARPIALGGQNYTHCCLRALNESLFVGGNGSLEYAAPSFVAPGVSVASLLLSAADSDTFPCGASFKGSATSAAAAASAAAQGSPEVRVPWAWCSSRCGGWEISHPRQLRQVGDIFKYSS